MTEPVLIPEHIASSLAPFIVGVETLHEDPQNARRHPDRNLGIIGDTAHQTTGTSYHLGKSQLSATAYSRQLVRDKAGLSEAASAIDIGKVGGSYKSLQALSMWLVRECTKRAIDTLDIREVIYSPDGVRVFRWDATNPVGVALGGTGTGQGDDSHRQHSHISWFRDAEFRDHTALFRRYWEDEVITAIKGEDWKPTRNPMTGGSNGVLRRTPDAGAPIIARLTLDQVARSIAHVTTTAATDSEWLLTQYGPEPAYMLVRDWTKVGDPEGLTDYLNQKPPIDCTPLVNAAREEGRQLGVTTGLRDGARAVKDAAVNAAVLLGG